MSLDQNLFTLIVTPSTESPLVVDLVDPTGRAHYRKQRVPGPVYRAEVYDPLSEALLVTATAPSATSKMKFLELYNPSTNVELKYTGVLSFRWSFKWEEHELEWKREECYLLRKPDPPVLVAVTKEPPGRLKTTSIQILDYNLNRFDIDDRKGLEIVILTALMTFQDSNEIYHTPEGSSSSIPRRGSNNTPTSPTVDPSPPPPPRPPKKLGIDRIAELQAVRGQFNEVTVEDEGSIEDYGQYCANLFQDDAMLFVTILSAGAEQVPKVLQVVEEIKRIRHKAGLEEELHQYVLYDTHARKGPRRINLDDTDNSKKYTPPESLTVHLSKIPMPELQPRAKPPEPSLPPIETKNLKNSKAEKKKEGKRKDDKKAATTAPPTPNKLTRPGYAGTPAYKVHPYQPSPSPSQLNNPAIYAAPPPPGNTLYPIPAGPPPIPARPDDATSPTGHRMPRPVSGLFDMFHRPRSAS